MKSFFLTISLFLGSLLSGQVLDSFNDLDISEPLSAKVELSKTFPNPFNPSTSPFVSMNHESDGSLIIYDLVGKEVRRLFDCIFDRGNTKVI